MKLAASGIPFLKITHREGEPHTLAETVDATNLSTNVAGGFVGTLIGPYCTTP